MCIGGLRKNATIICIVLDRSGRRSAQTRHKITTPASQLDQSVTVRLVLAPIRPMEFQSMLIRLCSMRTQNDEEDDESSLQPVASSDAAKDKREQEQRQQQQKSVNPPTSYGT